MPRSYERSAYRIPYPFVESPRLIVGTQVLQVVDCSEKGLRFRAAPQEVPEVGTRVQGRLRFPRGAEVVIDGTVVRVKDDEVALHLTDAGVPFRVILQEQIHLRRMRVE